MRPIMVSRRMLGWLGLLATVAAAGCTATSTSSSAGPGHARSASPAATTVTSQTYAVSISIPVSWQPTPDYTGQFAYDGTSGWVELNAMADPFGLHYACTVAATGNVLHPYGLHPHITYHSIDGRPGCLILPSSDALAQARRGGGPAFKDSEALVEYRQPPPISGCISPTGQPCRWSILVIDADPAHLVAIVDSVQLRH